MEHTQQPDGDAIELAGMGYSQKLNRTMGGYTSFALAFSLITITTTVFSLFAQPFQTLGGSAIWLWVPVTGGLMLVTLVYAHLVARIPVTGYAYQWSSRLWNSHYGWLTGWNACMVVMIGTAATAVAMATIFAGEIWTHPTQLQTEMFATGAILLAVIVNIIGIRFATMINNIGATTELIGTVGIAIVVVFGLLFFFKHDAGPSVLFHAHQVKGSSVSLTTLGLAALLPVYTLLGWEGSADLAEETKDPRRNGSRAMVRSVMVSGVAGFFVFAAFAMAIPHGVPAMASTSGNPVIYVIRQQLGGAVGSLLTAIALVSVFSAVLANVAGSTRFVYALARDNMLPGAKGLSWVYPKTRTPVLATILVGVFAVGVNFLDSGLIAKVTALVSVASYLTYLLTTVAALRADIRGEMPGADGYFSLGRWFRPVAWGAIAWCIVVICFMTLPAVNHIAAYSTLAGLAVGGLWYITVLRRRLLAGTAGPPHIIVPDPVLEAEYAVAPE